MRGGMRLGHMLGISFMIALFHMLMPLGLFAGRYVGMLLGHVTGLAPAGCFTGRAYDV